MGSRAAGIFMVLNFEWGWGGGRILLIASDCKHLPIDNLISWTLGRKAAIFRFMCLWILLKEPLFDKRCLTTLNTTQNAIFGEQRGRKYGTSTSDFARSEKKSDFSRN